MDNKKTLITAGIVGVGSVALAYLGHSYLVEKEESQMLRYKNFGRKSLTELVQKLGELNLKFGMDITQYLNAE